MKNIKNKKTLQIVLLVAIAVVTLGIGYASITAINLFINGNATATVNQNNFKVHFKTADGVTGTSGVSGTTTIDGEDDTVAYFDVSGLTKSGDYGIATYTVENASNAIGADITLNLVNSNNEYFKVTESIEDTQLQAGDTTTATVKVEMIKTPMANDVTTTVTAKLTASPIENESATGASGASKASDDPVSFATDSWATIKKAVHNNNTSAYHVGDTKTVTINNTDYTIRIANKSTVPNCGNSGYSETACGFVVEFVDIITTMQMKNSYSNAGGYPATDMPTFLNTTLYGQLPSDIQSVIEPTTVISGYGCISGWNWSTWSCSNPDNSGNNFTSTNQKLYLLSGKEIFDSYDFDTAANTTTQLEYYQGMEGVSVDYCPNDGGCWVTEYPRAVKQYNSSAIEWWLRSAMSASSDSIGRIASDGNIGATYLLNTAGVSPAFRIA